MSLKNMRLIFNRNTITRVFD
ncbi:hypothetical protein CY0110_17767 [Crocosphaera chwakensis CCY0110]|uniref:Uncharacterized protein n=1 Tax=Crocosphaera chwakensis CCY0110 TaxID=391612 RepID=A3IIN5_9CHRO|nr:hypothetical protein CY0110_17767 [Crocosphaera chwakensis CCY0110]